MGLLVDGLALYGAWRVSQAVAPMLRLQGYVGTSDVATAIVKSLRECPTEWSLGTYTAKHKSGRKVWIGNGMMFVHVEESNVAGKRHFGIWDKIAIYRAYSKLRRRVMASCDADLAAAFKAAT